LCDEGSTPDGNGVFHGAGAALTVAGDRPHAQVEGHVSHTNSGAGTQKRAQLPLPMGSKRCACNHPGSDARNHARWDDAVGGRFHLVTNKLSACQCEHTCGGELVGRRRGAPLSAGNLPLRAALVTAAKGVIARIPATAPIKIEWIRAI
jgi:hypothetical protein